MMHDSDYIEYYKILRINLNKIDKVDFKYIRQAYKTEIQKWHPDRYKEGTSQHDAANTKLKKLNIAYQALHDYYKSHKALPIVDQCDLHESSTHHKVSVATKAEISAKATNYIKNDNELDKLKHNSKNIVFAILSLSIIVITYTVVSHEPQLTQDRTYTHKPIIIKDSKRQLDHPNMLGKEPNLAPEASEKNKSTIENKAKDTTAIYFTLGSTVGDVIEIQGVPDHIEDDIWFYGKSEIHFKDGRVVQWVRSPETPLKARLKLN